MHVILYSLTGLVCAYIIIIAYMYVNQRNIIYFPDKMTESVNEFGITNAVDHHIKTSDGETLQAWHIPAKENLPTLVYLHGNAGNLADRVPKIKSFVDTGLGMLAVSYRGFGSSTGKPNEKGIYLDGRTAIAFAHENLNISMESLAIYGESLGSGVAVDIASENDELLAIILEAPYQSIAKRAKELYPFVPVDILLTDRFESLSKISKVKVPVLIFHGEDDAVMPVHHGRIMFEKANEPKKAIFYPHTGHSNFNYNTLAKETYTFLTSPH